MENNIVANSDLSGLCLRCCVEWLEEGLPIRGSAEWVRRRTDTIAQTYREGILCPALGTGFENAQCWGRALGFSNDGEKLRRTLRTESPLGGLGGPSKLTRGSHYHHNAWRAGSFCPQPS